MWRRMSTHSSSGTSFSPCWQDSNCAVSSTSPKEGKSSCRRRRVALISGGAPSSVVENQRTTVRFTATGSSIWTWLPMISRFGKMSRLRPDPVEASSIRSASSEAAAFHERRSQRFAPGADVLPAPGGFGVHGRAAAR